MEVIWLDDGRRVDLGELASGGSKNETRFGLIGAERVVVKIQRTHGRLTEEETALRFLAAHRVQVPRVISSGVTRGDQQFLVISREGGVQATTPEAWARFGHDLAALLDVPISGCPVKCVTTEEFVQDHHQRLDLVCARLTEDLVDRIALAISQIASVQRLVLTHGDPGSGNYLDNETGGGVLLDWETATISPFGLDLGRAVFIGLMDLGRTGIPEQLVRALISAYLERSSRTIPMNRGLVRAWTTVAGLQFIHGRHTQPLRADRTPAIAASVLATYLARA